MITPWYYGYYEKGAFPHQQELCEAVEWSKCNLNGQVQISPGLLTEIPANPLTLRLRALQKVLNTLIEEIDPINQRIKSLDYVGIGGSLYTQVSQLETGGAAIEKITIYETVDGNPVNTTFELHYDKVYFAIYDFFSNLGSILDRLAFEVNLLYQLGDWVKERLDWGKLTNKRKSNRFRDCLSIKDRNLSDFIQKESPGFERALIYRNRLVHDSIMSTDIKQQNYQKFSVFLPLEPKQDIERDLDAVDFCMKLKTDVLKLLDGSYMWMLQYHKSNGQPPW